MYLKYFKLFLSKMRTPHNECASFSFKVKQVHASFMRFPTFLRRGAIRQKKTNVDNGKSPHYPH